MERVPEEDRTEINTTAAEPGLPDRPVELNEPPPPRHMESDMKVHDPVCHRDLPITEAAAHIEYDGRGYSFCSLDRRDAFSADPEGVLRLEAARAPG